MHGLINRSIQCFLRDTYGPEVWTAIAARARLGFDNFEALLDYDPALTEAVLTAAELHLESPREMILEDVGTYLVSHPSTRAVRRLLRFGGENFVEFLFSLDDLRDRVRLAVPELGFPALELIEHSPMAFSLLVCHPQPGFGHALVGVLRAMADEYGALAMLDHVGRRDHVETISIELVEMAFSEGRAFALAVGA